MTDKSEAKTEATEVLKVLPVSHVEKFCIPHKRKLVYFCDSCQEPICQQCTALGPHNSQVSSIDYK